MIWYNMQSEHSGKSWKIITILVLMERVCMEISDRDGRNAMTPALMFTDSRKKW